MTERAIGEAGHLAPGAPDILIAGLGNPLRADDAVGLVVAQRLVAADLRGARVVEVGTDVTSLLGLWEGVGLAVVVDAAISGGPAGTMHVMEDAASLRAPAMRLATTHGVGLWDVVRLGSALGRMPRRLVVYAVEGADFGYRVGLTPDVESAVGRVVQSVASLVASPPAP